MAGGADDLVGQRVFFPVKWEEATLDSVLTGPRGDVLAYVLLRDNGEKVAIDAQMRRLEDFDG